MRERPFPVKSAHGHPAPSCSEPRSSCQTSATPRTNFFLRHNRAARKILAACRRGQPSLTLTFAARGAILGNALFPNFTGYAMKVVNRLLPGAANDEGKESRAGSETRRLVPGWLTRLADRATARNNENRVG